MDRPIVYSQEQVRNFDHMEDSWVSLIVGSSNLFADVTGIAATSLAGFVPTYNSNLTVTFSAGRIYASAVVDAAAYGGWPANNTVVYQQGQNPIQTLTFNLAGLSSGQSRWALVEVAYNQADVIPANDPTAGVLTYYNPANPTQPFVGPNNAGTPQPTLRQAQAVLTIKYGAVATTGSETPPTVDSGNVPMYLVHLTFGQTTITAANLFVAGPSATPNPPTYVAPFLSSTNIDIPYVATGTNTYAVTGTFVPLNQGQIYTVTFVNTNTGASTLALGSNAAVSIVQKNTLRSVLTGELQANYGYQLYFNGTSLVILNPTLNFNGAFVYQAAAQTLTTGVAAAIIFDTEIYKTISGFHSTGTNPTRLIAGQTGVSYVRITAQVSIAGNATGIRQLEIKKNGVSLTPIVFNEIAATLTAGNYYADIVSPIFSVATNDYFEVFVTQNSGGNLSTNNNASWAQLEILG